MKKIRDPESKLQALRDATAHSFPTADIEEMLAQIEGCAIAKHRVLLARQAKAFGHRASQTVKSGERGPRG